LKVRSKLLETVILAAMVILSGGASQGSSSGDSAIEVSQGDLLHQLRRGHWLEVRGTLQTESSGTIFLGERVEAKEPRRWEAIWGTAEPWFESQHLKVLGRLVKIQGNTEVRGAATPRDLIGQRVRVLGWRGASGRMIAHRVELRDPGVDRVVCRVDRIERRPDGGFDLRICDFQVVLGHDVRERAEAPIGALARVPPRMLGGSRQPDDLEDSLGAGYDLSTELHLSLRQDVNFLEQKNLALTDRDLDEDDVGDSSHALRGRLSYTPTSRFQAVGDFGHRVRDRRSHDDRDGLSSDFRLNELWFTIRQVAGFDVQIGRQDFDEPREWLFDQNLDALRLHRSADKFDLQLSFSRTLDDGSSRDLAADNTIVYLSNRSAPGRPPHHLAAYVVNRSFDLPAGRERATHFGVRALDTWSDNLRSWLEIAHLDGQRGGDPLSAWGADAGLVWRPEALGDWSLVASYAWGSGGERPGRDGRFRQTGLQDNDARLTGRTAVRYYGELIDPELSNLHITTLGFGYQPTRSHSFELLGHTYRQDVASTRLTRVDLERRPNGRDPELGWELDLVYSFQPRHLPWAFEVVAATFHQGRAFADGPLSDGDDARLLKAQLRYRYGRTP
jgi:alginate production protein